MSHPINDQIIEQIYEKWEIIPCTNGVGEWELSYEDEPTGETFDTKEEANQSIDLEVIAEFERSAR